jgi:hypothetical protein
MKTIINVYTKNIKPENHDGSSSTCGLGDFIRGTITLLRLSKELGFNLLVDLRYNAISNFLKKTDIDNLYLEEVDKNLDNLKFFFYVHNLKNYIIESFKTSDIVSVHTNAIWIEEEIYCYDNSTYPLSIEEKNYIKKIFSPNDELSAYIKERTINIPDSYNIIHFRLDDSFFNESSVINEEALNNYEESFKNNYDENSILLSNSKYFKNYIKSKYNVHVIDTNISHIGGDNNLIGIKDSLFDFFIQSNSKKIKTFSQYGWISGFIHWNCKVFDIPLEPL